MKPITQVEIPCTDPVRMQYWCDHLGFTVRKKGKNYWTIQTEHAINLYWLGCNLTMPAYTDGLTKHY